MLRSAFWMVELVINGQEIQAGFLFFGWGSCHKFILLIRAVRSTAKYENVTIKVQDSKSSLV